MNISIPLSIGSVHHLHPTNARIMAHFDYDSFYLFGANAFTTAGYRRFTLRRELVVELKYVRLWHQQ